MTTLDKQLRGLGRRAYRDGLLASQATRYAADQLERKLDARERQLVVDGWRDERSETAEP